MKTFDILEAAEFLKVDRTTVRPLLYKVSTVMEMLDISRTTVYRLIAKGDLKLIKIGISGSRITSASVHGILGTE